MMSKFLWSQNLRTYDEYTSELASGHLSWTPVHESDDFWKENAAKLNDKNHEQLKYALLLHCNYEVNIDNTSVQELDRSSEQFHWRYSACSRCVWYRPVCKALR